MWFEYVSINSFIYKTTFAFIFMEQKSAVRRAGVREGEWDTVHFHYMKKSSMNTLLNSSFCVLL